MLYMRFNGLNFCINEETRERVMREMKDSVTKGGSALLTITEQVNGEDYKSEIILTPAAQISFHHWNMSPQI